MADVRPFRGMRYRTEARTLATVVAPPYDVIEEDARQKLVELDEHNIVRVDLAADGYDEAAARWRRWQQDGVIVQEEQPALYAYKQTYTGQDGKVAARWGVMGAVRLAAYDERIVLPHERTLTGPKADRLQLMRTTRAQLSPVFGLHFGATGSVEELIAPACATDGSALSVTDSDGVVHEMWVLTDPKLLQAVAEALRPAQIVIADGHHRYETALAFRDEERARRAAAGETANADDNAAWNYVQMMLVDIESPGLTVFPTHRIVRGVSELTEAAFVQRLTDAFDISTVNTGADTAAAALRALDTLGETPGFAVYMSAGADARTGAGVGARTGTGTMLLAQLRDAGAWEKLTPGRTPAWRALDVSVIHELALPQLGLDDVKQSSGDYMTYSYTIEEAMAAVDAGNGDFALLVRPTPSDAVKEVALAGQNMPQKSTYYYPKLLTGLVMSALDSDVGL